MKAIGGIYSFGGAPVDEALRRALAEGLALHGSDGVKHFTSGSVAMVYRAFHTDKESRLETQPLVSNHGHILSWDGRLDNREELISILRNELREDHTDVTIVMAAYLKWNIDFLSKIIGDFALSLWDPFPRSLILARDVIGSRDLYYHRNQKRIIWSTDLGLLLKVSDAELEVDENYIAGYLTRLPDPWQSPFKTVSIVPPANVVIIRDSDVQIRRFWGLDPDREIRYQNDAEYEEHFLHLFRGAVRCCLRSDRPVWSDLSGGLDSSSIVCIADQLIKSGEAQAPALETVSCIRDESLSSNELRFIRYVEERIGKEGHHLPESQFPILTASVPEPSIIPNPLDIFISYHREVDKLMTDRGSRVRLCGSGGDQIFNSAPQPSLDLTDLLVRGNLPQLHQALCTWSRDRNKPYLKLLWADAVLPVLPRKLQVALRRDLIKRLPDWIDPEFAKRTNLRELMLGPSDSFKFHLPSGRSQSISFQSAVRSVSAGYARVLQSIEVRLPILHRPLVEFMQAIPKDQRARLGETRSLQRRALKGLMPPEILKRKGKGNPSEAVFRALSREYMQVHSLLCGSFVARYGYVNQQALMAALERSRYGDKRGGDIFRIISLEFWLRSLEQLRPTAKIDAAGMGSPEARPAAA